MNDEKRRERRSLSAADALWILVTVVGLVLIFLCMLHAKGSDGEMCQVRYVLRVHGVDAALLEAAEESLIPIGGEVRTGNGTAVLGRVESVTAEKEKQVALHGGDLHFAEVPDTVVLEIAVSGEAKAVRGDGLRISDVRIAAGSVGDFRIGAYYASRASVVYVERLEEESES